MAYPVNHPELVSEYTEELGDLRLGSADLERLRGALVDAIAEDPALDSEGLKCHLNQQGFAAVLASLLNKSVYDLYASAKPGVELSEAREGWLEALRLHKARAAAPGVDAGEGPGAAVSAVGVRR